MIISTDINDEIDDKDFNDNDEVVNVTGFKHDETIFF